MQDLLAIADPPRRRIVGRLARPDARERELRADEADERKAKKNLPHEK